MKKTFLILAFALAATLTINAQDDWKNEVGISYGFGSFTDLSSSYLNGIYTGKQTSYIGPFGIEYFYRLKSALGLGLVGTYGTCKWSDNDNARSHYISVMPALKYNWLNRDHFSMYSKMALGVIFGMDTGNDNKKTSVAVSWQASLVGAEFGSAFRGFLELGCGEQGILVAGLRYKF